MQSLLGQATQVTREERGIALTELVFVFPLLVILIIAAVELGHMLHLKQGVTFVTREAARYAFRECTPYRDDEAMDACVLSVRQRMESLGRSFLNAPALDLIVSIYEQGQVAPISKDWPGAATNGFTSHIEGSMGSGELAAMLALNSRVAVAEAELVHNPFFTDRIPGIVNVTSISFYELAIF